MKSSEYYGHFTEHYAKCWTPYIMIVSMTVFTILLEQIESLGSAPAAEPMRRASATIQSASHSDQLTAFHQRLSNYYHTRTYKLITITRIVQGWGTVYYQYIVASEYNILQYRNIHLRHVAILQYSLQGAIYWSIQYTVPQPCKT